jgi:hypothetical protein
MEDPAQLAREAFVVGVAIIPLWWTVRQVTTAMSLGFTSENKATLDVALSAALLHLVAEETGVNTWYLTNSFAAQKAFSKLDGVVVSSDLGGLRLDNY